VDIGGSVGNDFTADLGELGPRDDPVGGATSISIAVALEEYRYVPIEFLMNVAGPGLGDRLHGASAVGTRDRPFD
jgi:hypothetical protein